jgi:hypothetical protein
MASVSDWPLEIAGVMRGAGGLIYFAMLILGPVGERIVG